jgi:hypothetical protein
MNINATKYCMAFLLFFTITRIDFIYCQADLSNIDDTIHVSITNKIHSLFGNSYSVDTFNFDTLLQKGKHTEWDNEITDPYNKLKGCTLFGASRYSVNGGDERNSIFGIYKNGNILWQTEPLITGTFSHIFATSDINNDGEVEVLTAWGFAPPFDIEFLWIFSWNGKIGKIINQIDQRDSSSTIISHMDMFKLVDSDKKGIMNIQCYWKSDKEDYDSWFPMNQSSTKPWVTYFWNGSMYEIENEQPLARIESLVKTEYGADYKVAVQVISATPGKRPSGDVQTVTDPYGTLQGCVLFSAIRLDPDQDSGFFGIYKNGRILWTSEHIIYGVWHEVYATADINNDGKVDILTTWYPRGDARTLLMWIFTWDGNTGKIINEQDPLQTTIKGANFILMDTEKKGVKEIVGEFRTGDIHYRWNGSLYVRYDEPK